MPGFSNQLFELVYLHARTHTPDCKDEACSLYTETHIDIINYGTKIMLRTIMSRLFKYLKGSNSALLMMGKMAMDKAVEMATSISRYDDQVKVYDNEAVALNRVKSLLSQFTQMPCNVESIQDMLLQHPEIGNLADFYIYNNDENFNELKRLHNNAMKQLTVADYSDVTTQLYILLMYHLNGQFEINIRSVDEMWTMVILEDLIAYHNYRNKKPTSAGVLKTLPIINDPAEYATDTATHTDSLDIKFAEILQDLGF